MATRDLSVRYEALLIAVREALDEIEDGSSFQKADRVQAILLNALEEIGERRVDDSWAV